MVIDALALRVAARYLGAMDDDDAKALDLLFTTSAKLMNAIMNVAGMDIKDWTQEHLSHLSRLRHAPLSEKANYLDAILGYFKPDGEYMMNVKKLHDLGHNVYMFLRAYEERLKSLQG